MRILGIDPGTVAMGYGVIESRDSETTLIDCGVLSTSPRSPMGERLVFLYRNILEVIDKSKPDTIAIEQPFVSKNVKTAFAIGRAQAIAILAAADRGVPYHEYSPAQVKQRVANYGGSSKEQVQEMVRLQLGLAEAPSSSDAADALAVALCHLSEMHIDNLLSGRQ